MKAQFSKLKPNGDFSDITAFFKPRLNELKAKAQKATNFSAVAKKIKDNTVARVEVITSNIDLVFSLIEDIYHIVYEKYEFERLKHGNILSKLLKQSKNKIKDYIIH